MKTTIDGIEYRIGFRHQQKFEDKDGKRIPRPFAKPPLKEVRAVTECYVAQGTALATSPGQLPMVLRDMKMLATAEAVCSWADTFDKEFARQVSLARTIVQLPRAIAGRVLGAYLTSAQRPIANLEHVKISCARGVVKVKTISDAVKLCMS